MKVRGYRITSTSGGEGVNISAGVLYKSKEMDYASYSLLWLRLQRYAWAVGLRQVYSIATGCGPNIVRRSSTKNVRYKLFLMAVDPILSFR